MPRLDDDGQQVTLDLHGARVDEALALAIDVARAAVRSGRSTLRIVHGHSTTGDGSRTIKSAVLDALADGTFGTASALRAEGVTTLGLPVGTRPDLARLRLSDFW